MQYYIERIQNIIDYIEQNLNKDLTLEQLASHVYCSKFHFHRTFQAMVGEPVMEYIRKRRVTLAANEILKTERKLIDIAYDSGFCSQVDFSRTFKRIYGITPMECRKRVRTVELYEKVNLLGRSFSKEKSSFLNGPSIIDVKGFNVVGLELKASFEENMNKHAVQELWNKFTMDKDLISGVINPYTAYGISYEGRYLEYFNYLAGVEVRTLDNIPAGMSGRVIPDCKYAVFNFKAVKDGFAVVEEFYKALDYIFGHWLPNTGYELAPDNDLVEVITSDAGNIDRMQMDIRLPIK